MNGEQNNPEIVRPTRANALARRFADFWRKGTFIHGFSG